jgi:tetratricopeptide (TPR) repeat protein
MPAPINATIARLIRQANSALTSGNFPAAQTVARQAVEKAEAVLHKPSQAAAHYTLATVLWSDETAPAAQAQEHAAAALVLSAIHTEEYYMAMTLLARIEAGIGNFDQARKLNQNLLDIYKRKNRQKGVADIMRSFGDLAMKEGNLTEARQYFQQSLVLYETKIHDPLNQAGLLLSLGSLSYREGNLTEARQHWEAAKLIGVKENLHQIVYIAEQALTPMEEDTRPNG